MTPRLALLPLALALTAQVPLHAQNESRLHSDIRREFEALQPCTKFALAHVAGCAQTLVTGQPFHVAIGSIAPQNGTAFGLAFVEHTDLQSRWRLTYNLDAVASGNASWRTGAYLKAFRQPGGVPVVNHPAVNPVPNAPAGGQTAPLYNVAPLFDLYTQTTSLNRVDFYGLGPDTPRTAHTTFGLTETITGVKATVPIASRLGLGVLAEVNGRFPSIRPGRSQSIPSTQATFTESTAPGVSHQQAFFQAGEGIRLRPSLAGDILRLNYLLQFQQFVAASDAHNSFRRWTVDLNHEIPLYRKVRLTAANDHNGPDSCATNSGLSSPPPCPPVSLTQNLEGSISARLLISESFASAGNAVPFYLMPTLGGSDINGQPLLPSYPDYRFRGPDLLLLRGTVEHSLGKLPIGALFSFDAGKVANRRDGIAFDHLRHSFSAGLTLHAGGLPVVNLLFAWGGSEGHHTSATINNALLGGSPRPSLF